MWLISFDKDNWDNGFYEFETYEDTLYSIGHIGALRLYNEWLDFIGSEHIEVSEELAMRYCVIGRIFQYENNEEGLTVPVVNNIKYVFHQG
ncbi:hypothetical protein [Lysinibacillus irui]|uniref:Uncharacterized protein n=1 Tax=Lysinibacillus irui TaxID=2998077 RepID=A0AAJ5RMM3_9BACI|nr:hypothetical protein [Lysinibacillus irui]WDV09227.1 hypothetical protein OU989_23350 [Lysinibacillus irui]